MEFASLEREIYVAAAPEVVFEVVSRPEHIRHWWPDDAAYDVRPGGRGEIRFGDPEQGEVVATSPWSTSGRRSRSRSAGPTTTCL